MKSLKDRYHELESELARQDAALASARAALHSAARIPVDVAAAFVGALDDAFDIAPPRCPSPRPVVGARC